MEFLTNNELHYYSLHFIFAIRVSKVKTEYKVRDTDLQTPQTKPKVGTEWIVGQRQPTLWFHRPVSAGLGRRTNMYNRGSCVGKLLSLTKLGRVLSLGSPPEPNSTPQALQEEL